MERKKKKYLFRFVHFKGFPSGASPKESACQCRRYETWVRSLGWEDPLEKGMATDSSIPA